jgi:hypothetical protein
MSRTVFHIEDRGNKWIAHWILYMLCGLRHVNNNTSRNDNNVISNLKGGGMLEQNVNLYKPTNVNKPYNIYIPYIKEFTDFQKESLELISDSFNLISEINDDDIVINNYGEFIDIKNGCITTEGYEFIRNLYLPKCQFENKFKNKKYYLSRSKSHLLSGNQSDNSIKRRQVINEEELSDSLKKYDIETIFLEDYNFKEKIQIFQESELIISPNSGGLTFSLFADQNTKIIELNVKEPSQISNTYYTQCSYLKIPYYRYITNKIDLNDNMIVDCNDFINNFLNELNK